MKKTFAGLIAILAIAATAVQAASVDEIVSGYFDVTGGQEAWEKLEGLRMTGEMIQGEMKFPFELVQQKNGRQYLKFSVQGKDFKQGVFDGETLWGTNFMSMKAEKADAEATANQKLDANDFPSDFLNYRDKGYTAELLDNDTIDGTETYKIKLTKEPVTVDGNSVANVAYYFFDTDSMALLAVETEVKSGPAKGKTAQTKLSDYQEVDGLYFPFSITQGLKDGPQASMLLQAVELNPAVDDAAFVMPAEEEAANDPAE